MKKIAWILVAALLGACTAITKVEGEQLINARLAVRLPDAWNKYAPPGNAQPFDTWTQEGITLDQLRFWSAIKPEQALVTKPPAAAPTAAGAKAPRVPTFSAGMQPDQIANLFEAVFSADGSIVQMTRVEPALFAGQRGIHFEFSVTRKGDDVQLLGSGWAAVRNNELFAATFVAPRLSFYGRLAPKAKAVIDTAQIKG